MARSTTRKRKRSFGHPSRKYSNHTSGERKSTRRYKRKKSRSKRTRAAGWFSRTIKKYEEVPEKTEKLPKNMNIKIKLLKDKSTRQKYYPYEIKEVNKNRKKYTIKLYLYDDENDLLSPTNSIELKSITLKDKEKSDIVRLIASIDKSKKEFIKQHTKFQQNLYKQAELKQKRMKREQERHERFVEETKRRAAYREGESEKRSAAFHKTEMEGKPERGIFGEKNYFPEEALFLWKKKERERKEDKQGEWPEAVQHKEKRSIRMSPRKRSISHAPSPLKK